MQNGLCCLAYSCSRVYNPDFNPAELRSTLQGWIRALDSKLKICSKKLINF
jgi:hypothetical protein